MEKRLERLEALLLQGTCCDTCIGWPRFRVVYEDPDNQRENRPARCPTCGGEAIRTICVQYEDGPREAERSFR